LRHFPRKTDINQDCILLDHIGRDQPRDARCRDDNVGLAGHVGQLRLGGVAMGEEDGGLANMGQIAIGLVACFKSDFELNIELNIYIKDGGGGGSVPRYSSVR
jgi:hypothetical protein